MESNYESVRQDIMEYREFCNHICEKHEFLREVAARAVEMFMLYTMWSNRSISYNLQQLTKTRDILRLSQGCKNVEIKVDEALRFYVDAVEFDSRAYSCSTIVTHPERTFVYVIRISLYNEKGNIEPAVYMAADQMTFNRGEQSRGYASEEEIALDARSKKEYSDHPRIELFYTGKDQWIANLALHKASMLAKRVSEFGKKYKG